METVAKSRKFAVIPSSCMWVQCKKHLSPIWDTDSLDWKDLSASEITKRVTGKAQSGSICLFHNAALHTPEALPAILEYFGQNGYTVVPISQILLDGEYYVDHTGKQCPVR